MPLLGDKGDLESSLRITICLNSQIFGILIVE